MQYETIARQFADPIMTDRQREALRGQQRALAARTRWHALLAVCAPVSAAGVVLLAWQLTATVPVPALVGIGLLAAVVLPLVIYNHNEEE